MWVFKKNYLVAKLKKKYLFKKIRNISFLTLTRLGK